MDIIVVKIGGNIIDNTPLLEHVMKDFATITKPKILVHGGGVLATALQQQLGIAPKIIDGRRVTDMATLRIATMVYAGWCNKTIVALLHKYGCSAVGLSGADGNVIESTKRPLVVTTDGNVHYIDYGYVGDVDTSKINAPFLIDMLSRGITPVLCAITHDGRGTLLNTNADTIAAGVATALAAYTTPVSLVYCFEKDGVLYDTDDDSSMIDTINPEYYVQLRGEGRISAGMLPKLDNAFAALRAGVATVIVKHARNLLNDRGTVLSL